MATRSANHSAESKTDHEFIQPRSEVILVLSSRMKWAGIFFVGFGVMSGIISLSGGIAVAMLAAVVLLTGIWTINVSRSLLLLSKTADIDITNLMNALLSLKRLYKLQFWLSLIWVVSSALVIAIFGFV